MPNLPDKFCRITGQLGLSTDLSRERVSWVLVSVSTKTVTVLDMRCTVSRKAGIRRLRHLPTIVVLTLGLGLLFRSAQAQEPASPPPRLKVTSNLVVVRVVVSDRSGHSVLGLHEGDFKIFDRGNEQSIVHFEESSFPPDKSAVAVHSPEQTSIPLSSEISGPRASPILPKNFLALYFDNLSTTDTDLAAARNAAERYLSSSLKPNDRVAIFTSEQLLADFTDDPRQLLEALGNLHVSVRARASALDCPHLSDYQALQITEFAEEPHADAWILARDEMVQCSVPSSDSAQATENSTGRTGKSGGKGSSGHLANEGFDRDPDVAQILNLARSVVLQNQILVRSNLQQIDRVVQRLSQMSDQRSMILVSPGFLAQTEQFQLDRIVDRALRSQVVINSLDPKGLAGLMRSANASLGYNPTHGDAARASRVVDSNRENAVTSVLAEVAQGTGGKYMHNNNDLKAGFAALERSPACYILAFAPTDLKPDGAFHPLKVTLAGGRKDFTIQARRGYFAPKGDAPVDTSAESGNDAAEQAQHERIQQQVLSKVDVSQLPVDLTNNLAQQPDQTRVLSVSTHLDTQALQFRREADHNLNTITFVVAVFDPKDKLIEAQQRHISIDSLDAQLPDVLKLGLEATFAFKLRSGTYRLRAVVIDYVQHLVGAKSDSVTIP
jgi:VWFA-related protein